MELLLIISAMLSAVTGAFGVRPADAQVQRPEAASIVSVAAETAEQAVAAAVPAVPAPAVAPEAAQPFPQSPPPEAPALHKVRLLE